MPLDVWMLGLLLLLTLLSKVVEIDAIADPERVRRIAAAVLSGG
jgi:hypothetical protein